MKKFLFIPIVALLIAAGFGIHRSIAAPSYPSSLDVSAYGNYHSPLIQPTNSSWTINFSWDSTLPSNQSADVMVINQDGTVKDNHLVGPTTGGGSFSMAESGNSPVSIAINAGSWHLTAQ